jgi:hypothetical protein
MLFFGIPSKTGIPWKAGHESRQPIKIGINKSKWRMDIAENMENLVFDCFKNCNIEITEIRDVRKVRDLEIVHAFRELEIVLSGGAPPDKTLMQLLLSNQNMAVTSMIKVENARV